MNRRACSHKYTDTRVLEGIETPSAQPPEKVLEHEAGAEDPCGSHCSFGGFLFSGSINPSLLQRPKLGSHLSTEVVTFEMLQSK